MKIKRKFLKEFRNVLFIWRAITIIILCTFLIPLFVENIDRKWLYSTFIIPGLLLYVPLTFFQLKMKKGVIKGYLENTATKLLLAMASLSVTFMLLNLGVTLLSQVFCVVSAVLYALFLQRISFIKFIL